MMMAKIGEREFEVGAEWRGVAADAGEILFRSKDTWFGDNDGGLRVTLTSDPPGTPTGTCPEQNRVRKTDYQFFGQKKKSVNVAVSSTEGWQFADAEVSEGVQLTINAVGQWGSWPGDRTSTPETIGMRLICKISQAPQSPRTDVFIIDRHLVVKAPISGKIYFRCEDGNLSDNHGAALVKIVGEILTE